jgi:magnesium transporter
MRRLTRSRARKAGLPPGTAVHIGETRAETTRIRLMCYSAETFEEREVQSIEELAGARGRGVTWVHVTGVHDVELLARLGDLFDLHPLVREDISNTDQRPKLENYDAYAYVVVRMLHDGPTGHEVKSEQISLVLGKDFVLSFEEAEPTVFEQVRERLRHNRGRFRAHGADYLAYTLLDAVVDNYFVVLERLGERIEALQDEFIARPTLQGQQRLHALRREVIFLRRAVWPLREVIVGLERGGSPLVTDSTRLYMRDVYDHSVHVIETVETFRDTLASLLDIYLMSLSNRMNEIMKVLTVIATLFIPPTLIASVYGMNFRNMPELGWTWGYPFALVLMLGAVVGMLIYFRRKKWF